LIKYIGSKRRLVPLITAVVGAIPGVRRVLDLFSGTSRVGWALKQRGYEVVANDHNTYAHVLARCYVQADADRVLEEAVRRIEALRNAEPRDGWFTETFCRRSRFFHPDNGARIEGMREAVRAWDLEGDLEAVVLVALMEAADRVDSTTGVQMAYLKQWAPRALGMLELRVPDVLPGPGRALMAEAWEAAAEVESDLVYIDPPYNQHSYRANYHVWETLVRWDEPETYGVACKRTDCRTHKSPFNSKAGIRPALERVLDAARAPILLLSFSDEGYIAREDLEAMLRDRGHVAGLAVDHPRYVGARIGIYNPKGEKVGRVGRLRNRELLYVVAQDPSALTALENADLPPLAVA
jgi:adenine-specific DNA-methyltransferase